MLRVVREEHFRYFPQASKNSHWGIYVAGTGWVVQRQEGGTPSPGHPPPFYYVWRDGRTLPYYSLVYVTQGLGEFDSKQTGHLMVEPGNMILLFPNVWHRHRPAVGKSWSQHWIHFGGPMAKEIYQHEGLSPEKPILKTGLDDTLLRAFLTLWERAESEPHGYNKLMAASVIEILGVMLTAARAESNQSHHDKVIRRAVEAIRCCLESSLNMRELADSLHMSYDHFRHIFKEHTGMPPHQYQLDLRIHRAKELLTGTTLSVTEIAKVLQFEDPRHFSRLFKKKLDLSPSEWRNIS